MNPRLVAVEQVIRVLLVDDQQIVREGLRMLLENNNNIEVVGEASAYDEAVESAARLHPDIILLDLDLGGKISGKDCLPAMLQASPLSRVLVLTGTQDPQLHYEAIRLGASGLVHKLEASNILLNAIRKLNDGEVWLDGSIMANILHEYWSMTDVNAPPKSGGHRHLIKFANGTIIQPETFITDVTPQDEEKIALLTNREKEVIELIGQGMRNQQIADQLFISVITVRHHLSSIFSKLEVSDRFELAIYAYKYGLAKLPTE